jgi:predicted RND superfamily exporter protein
MILTAAVVSIGFLTLTASTFNGLVQLGLITGVALLSAMFADLFLSPLLVRLIRPPRAPASPPENRLHREVGLP